jgi:hypothetical protein
MNPPSGKSVDHKNRDKLDNRRANLQVCTPSQNSVRRITAMPHGYRGVTRLVYPNMTRWRSVIGINGRGCKLGVFDTAEEAAQAYNHAAAWMHGEFAILNDIPEQGHIK